MDLNVWQYQSNPYFNVDQDTKIIGSHETYIIGVASPITYKLRCKKEIKPR